MSFTYLQLKTAVQDYTENNETTFVNNIPMFIRISEERILKSVQLSLFRKNASANISVNSQFFACPSDFLAPFSLSFALTSDSSPTKEFVDFKDPSFLQTFNPQSTGTGRPKYYAIYDVSNFLTNVSVILNLSAPGAEKFVLPIALSYKLASSSAVTILSSTFRPTLYDGLVSY